MRGHTGLQIGVNKDLDGRLFWGLTANIAKFSTKRWRTRPKDVFFSIWGLLASSGPKTAFVRLFGFSADRFSICAGERGGKGGGGAGTPLGGNGGERGDFGGSAVLVATVPKSKTPRKIHGSCPVSQKNLQTAVNSEKRVLNSAQSEKNTKMP